MRSGSFLLQEQPMRVNASFSLHHPSVIVDQNSPLFNTIIEDDDENEYVSGNQMNVVIM